MNEIPFDGTLAGWKQAARSALARGCDPAQTHWLPAGSAQAELGLADQDTSPLHRTATGASQPQFDPPTPQRNLPLPANYSAGDATPSSRFKLIASSPQPPPPPQTPLADPDTSPLPATATRRSRLHSEPTAPTSEKLPASSVPSDSPGDGTSRSRLELTTPPSQSPTPPAPIDRPRVPRAFTELVEDVACHSEPTRWALLYRTLWRLTHGEPHLIEITTDADIHTLRSLAKAVHRDIHKMRAFVRFREVQTDTGPWFVAWFEPQHHIVEANAPFFRDRFTNMRWSIFTPERCVHWDPEKRALSYTTGVPKSAAPTEDATEDLWLTYYASIFNPARVKISAMTSEMPRHYWKNLPEAKIIPGLLADSRPRVETMVEKSSAQLLGADDFLRPQIPNTTDLDLLRDAAATCRACPLWRNATCTVFGEGPSNARIVIVGEQPGDHEDRQGKPFIGPAGQLLDRAFAEAGIDRKTLYVTNAVKHFKWEPRGKRRIHQKPNSREIAACRPWLETQLHAIKPDLIVCLGSTAALSVTGRAVKVLSERGEKLPTEFGAPALITVHPSSLLRLPDGANPEEEFAKFVADLRKIVS